MADSVWVQMTMTDAEKQKGAKLSIENPILFPFFLFSIKYLENQSLKNSSYGK